MTDPVAERLEQQRQKLLDLTRRNRLLNFKPTRRTTVRIVDEVPSELFRLTALEGKTLGFLPGELGVRPEPDAPPAATPVGSVVSEVEPGVGKGESDPKSSGAPPHAKALGAPLSAAPSVRATPSDAPAADATPSTEATPADATSADASSSTGAAQTTPADATSADATSSTEAAPSDATSVDATAQVPADDTPGVDATSAEVPTGATPPVDATSADAAPPTDTSTGTSAGTLVDDATSADTPADTPVSTPLASETPADAAPADATPPPALTDSSTFFRRARLELDARHRDNDLQSEIDASELEKNLVAISRASASTLEEQGFNSLFMALGFLEWVDRDSGKRQQAPILLAPVELKRKNVRSRFRLSAGEDDPLVNPALAYKLNQDWGIELPELSSDLEEVDPDAVLEDLAQKIAGLEGWRVSNECCLALFSFTKFVMYKDLELHAGRALGSPLTRRLLGDVGADLPQALVESRPPQAVFSVMDADASQREAVEAALAGESMVLEGPPGTGKSQTITNVVAELLGAGKTVLFVSEKMAALEVVQQRLTDVGLGEFCLELHSRHANKRALVRNLAATLELEPQPDHAEDSTLAALDTVERELDAYAGDLHAPHGPLGATPFQVLGGLQEREGIFDPLTGARLIATLEGADTWTQEALAEREQVLGTLETYLRRLGPRDQHPLRGVGLRELDYASRGRFLDTLAKAMDACAAAERAGLDLAEVALAVAPTCEGQARAVLDVASLLLHPRLPAPEVLANPAWDQRSPRANVLIDLSERAGAACAEANAVWLEAVYEREDLMQLAERYQGYQNKWWRIFAPGWYSVCNEIRALRKPDVPMDDSGKLVLEITQAERARRELAAFRATESEGRALFGGVWPGTREALDEVALLAVRFRGHLRERRLQPALQELLAAGGPDPKALHDRHQRAIDQLAGFARVWAEFVQATAFDLEAAFGVGTKLESLEWSRLAERLREIGESTDGLDDWVLLQRNLGNADSLGLGAFVECVEEHDVCDLTSGEIADASSAAEARATDKTQEAPETHADANAKSDHQMAASAAPAAGGLDPTEAGSSDAQEADAETAGETATSEGAVEASGEGTGPEANGESAVEATGEGTGPEAAGGGAEVEAREAEATGDEGTGPEATIAGSDAEVASGPPTLADVLRQAFFRRWLDGALRDRPRLGGFDPVALDDRVGEFRRLDRRQLQLARVRLRHRLAAARPDTSWLASKESELGLLQRELRRKRGHLPVRQLLRRIPTVIRALKPCMLMSPLTVAQFTDPELHAFDAVVFDEASQIAPEDALGSLLRGKQAVVVGDSRQMPPTSFFKKTVATEGEDDDEAEPDLESILDECVARGLPQRTLRWHYRSRHESLIAFSNRHFYEGRLRTFPSPDDGGGSLGLSLEHVEGGAYQRGGSGKNPTEADAVADAVIEHYRREPGRSLGVGAFSQAQQDAILDAVERRLRAEPELESLLGPEEEEHFFVKNLENLQGDERDVIFISIGYGPDAKGKMSVNFGPLNRSGGERRLNVLVTRAREQVRVFCSFLPDQLDLRRTQAHGVHLLKHYLELAKRGEVAKLEEDAPVEGVERLSLGDAIAQALQLRGHTTLRDLGTSGVRVDVAIVDAEGRALLGVLLDGERWAAFPSPRDRERVVPGVLEHQRWALHRVWALDWHRRPDEVLKEIEASLAEAKEARAEREAAEAAEAEADAARAAGADGAEAPAETASPDTTTQADEPSGEEIALKAVAPRKASPIAPYKEHPVDVRGDRDAFATVDAKDLDALVTSVIAVEGPIHLDELERRVLAHWDLSRSGKRARASVGDAVMRATEAGAIRSEGEFVWPAGVAEAPVRDRAKAGPRGAELIPPQELAAALRLVAQKEFRIARTDLLKQAGKVLGFSRPGSKLKGVLGQALDALVTTQALAEEHGVVTV